MTSLTPIATPRRPASTGASCCADGRAQATPESAGSRDARIAELSQLVEAFSGITERLQQSHAALTEKVARLQSELAEKNRLLSDQQKQLERKNRLSALGEMAAGLAHEIRNPLGGIGLYAGMLEEDLADRPESLELLAKVQSGVRRVERTVSQVLRFAGEVVAETSDCDAAEAVRAAVELAAGQAQRHGVEVGVEAPASLRARVDADLVTQAVLNLLLNAIDVARHVEVRCSVEGGKLHVCVTDDGPGLPEGVDPDRLFDPFFTTKDTGTGLGLSIVHRIAEAHGGHVAARSSPEGAAFTLVL